MRILLNSITFLVFIGSFGLFTLFLLPDIERPDFSYLFQNKDVPMPTILHPKVAEYRDELVERSNSRGIDVVITEGHRTEERQRSLYAQGRSENGQIVTYAKAGESYHNYGLAIDYALRLENGDVVWDIKRDDNGNGKADWLEVASIAKELGFEWGGDWENFKDYPHLQMDFGLSIWELKRGKRPKIDSFAVH